MVSSLFVLERMFCCRMGRRLNKSGAYLTVRVFVVVSLLFFFMFLPVNSQWFSNFFKGDVAEGALPKPVTRNEEELLTQIDVLTHDQQSVDKGSHCAKRNLLSHMRSAQFSFNIYFKSTKMLCLTK